MSFASQVREEISRSGIQKECCVRAACYGVACFSKYFDEKGLVLQTDQRLTAYYARDMFARCGICGQVEERLRGSGIRYEFAIAEPNAVEQLHQLFGTTGRETSIQIDPTILRCRTCVSAYIGAAFLCGGTITDPQKEYNLEFMTPRTNLSKDFEALLAEHEFAPHRTRRQGVNLVYVKASQRVQELLLFMGAECAAQQIESEKNLKLMRNRCNRQANCDIANITKTTRANQKVLKAIQYLEENGLLQSVESPLREAAEKRRQYPDLSLTALGRMFQPELSKSGLSHRMRRLELLAEEQKRKQEQEATNG